jgi:isoleucyl-tRNA synthetase
MVLLPDPDSEETWAQGRNAVRNVPADALRWATYSRSTPEEAEQRFLRPVWQLAEDLLAGDVQPIGEGENDVRNELLGRWLKASLYQAVSATTAALDDSNAYQAACVMQGLVRDLTTWYALSRPGGERTAIMVLSPLLAPFVPHLADAIHRRVSRSKGESVHLGSWPSPQPAWADPELVAQMSLLQRLALLGETARAQAGIGPDLPVGQAIVVLDEARVARQESLSSLKDLLAEMLRAARVRIVSGPVTHVRWQLDLEESVVERGTPLSIIREALAELNPERAAEMALQLEAGLSVGLAVGPQTITLLPDEVKISVQSEPGWIAAESSGQVVALNLA